MTDLQRKSAFDEFVSGLDMSGFGRDKPYQPEQPAGTIDCDTVHPVVERVLADFGTFKLELPDDDLTEQAQVCLITEIIDRWLPALAEVDQGDVDEKEWFADDADRAKHREFFISYEDLEKIVHRSICLGYITLLNIQRYWDKRNDER